MNRIDRTGTHSCDPLSYAQRLCEPEFEGSGLLSILGGCAYTAAEAFAVAPPTPLSKGGFAIGGCVVGGSSSAYLQFAE